MAVMAKGAGPIAVESGGGHGDAEFERTEGAVDDEPEAIGASGDGAKCGGLLAGFDFLAGPLAVWGSSEIDDDCLRFSGLIVFQLDFVGTFGRELQRLL